MLIMRLIFLVLFTILGANLLVSVLDSKMVETINERNERMEQLINKM
jgi:hypothetical protein